MNCHVAHIITETHKTLEILPPFSCCTSPLEIAAEANKSLHQHPADISSNQGFQLMFHQQPAQRHSNQNAGMQKPGAIELNQQHLIYSR